MKGHILSVFKVREISPVDVPAQVPALALMRKRAGIVPDAVMNKRAALTTNVDGHSHLIDFGGFGTASDACEGMTSYQNDHAHPWVVNPQGEVVIGEADGHAHDVATMSKGLFSALLKIKPRAGESESDYMSRFMRDKKMTGEYPEKKQRAAIAHKMFGKSAAADPDESPDEGEGSMPDKNEVKDDAVAALTKSVAELKSQNDALAKKAERADKVEALSDTERAFFKSLKGEAADAFLAADSGARSNLVRKAAKDAEDQDPVIHTTRDGRQLRKSAGADTIALWKRIDQKDEENECLRKAHEDADLAKRAGEFEFLPGGSAVTIAQLRAIDGIKDEAIRKGALEQLRAANAAAKSKFVKKGTSSGGNADATDGATSLQKIADGILTKSAGTPMTRAEALIAAAKTPEGRRLYAEAVSGEK